MAAIKKILHLSDTHVCYEGLALKLDDLTENLISEQIPADDHIVVVTGDIVEDATREGSYEKAGSALDKLNEAGFGVLVVPGNHDYGTGSIGYPKYVERFKRCFFGNAGITYPKLDIVENIAFIGLDSMAEELHWYDRLFAEGELGGNQLERLEEMLENEQVRKSEYTVVYLHHHPFHPWPFHQLKDSDGLKESLKGRRVDALLFGHNHQGLSFNGGWGIDRVHDAGTSTGKDVKPGPLRVIDLSEDHDSGPGQKAPAARFSNHPELEDGR